MLNYWFFSLIFLISAPLFTEEMAPVNAELTADHKTITAAQTFELLLDVTLADGWHAYWKNPGDTGMAPSIEWDLPQGVEVIATHWPTPERFEAGDLITFGYSHRVPFIITLQTDKNFTGKELEIKGAIDWIVCSSETCLPGRTEFKTTLQMGSEIEPHTLNQKQIALAKQAHPADLPAQFIARHKGSLLVSFPEEVALSDVPHFFSENPDYKHQAKINKKQIEIPLLSDQSLKGVLVVGNKAFSMDVPPALEDDAEGELNLLWALIFALTGGLILNLMPCVLPVVSLKVMSFIKMAGDSRREMIKQGVAFSSGVLVSFWALALLLIGLQKTGQAVGWGFQLQNPLFIAALALLFTFLALNLLGVFEMGTSLAGIAGDASQVKPKKGFQGAFWSGVFATAVATPCTGPFMGSALGYAVTQPPIVSLAIFTALGLGMSLPYLLIGFFPSCIRWLPKPGTWMENFKHILGFIMLATVIWLLWVFNSQTGELGLFLLLSGLLIASFSAWIYGSFSAIHKSPRTRKLGYLLSSAFLICSLGLIAISAEQGDGIPAQEQAHSGWEPFSQKRVAELQKAKQPILIDFTAKWCLICQANHLVMMQNKVMKKFQEHGVTLMKADWTRYDPEITEALKKFGRNGVPLYVLYGPSGEPMILPQVLTPDAVISALEQAAKNVY